MAQTVGPPGPAAGPKGAGAPVLPEAATAGGGGGVSAGGGVVAAPGAGSSAMAT